MLFAIVCLCLVYCHLVVRGVLTITVLLVCCWFVVICGLLFGCDLVWLLRRSLLGLFYRLFYCCDYMDSAYKGWIGGFGVETNDGCYLVLLFRCFACWIVWFLLVVLCCFHC